ncbi:endo-alpha-N-acetylgalactosaminidase family protein [Nocardioides sp. YIM B13467]|uniref:endo-alpha-N-acetylgalactosaminidase family protein n=1 Tax=Nocardioides sp. YIM B13467 TaxID=3366294 RepID=UPI0036705036
MPKRFPTALLASVTAFAGVVAIAPESHAAPAGGFTLTSPVLSVRVADDFPAVLGYRHTAGGEIGGAATTPTAVRINGTAHTATVAGTQVDADTATYRLTFADLPGVELDAKLEVAGDVVTFAVTKVTDTAEHRVGTLDIPGHDLLSVSSDQAGATVNTAVVSADRTTNGDTHTEVTADLPTTEKPVGSAYAIVDTDQLAAAIETNSVYDQSSGDATRERGRIWRSVSATDSGRRVGLWSGQWTYRATGSPYTEELPWAKVTITPDANGDQAVDWQDGAIALRDIQRPMNGADETPERVVTHIPFNFASQATHPFLRTLDDVKRVSLATDGLGQLAVLKGYGSEGHDSAHPDYGGNYNTRAGGLDDLNTLVRAGEKWGADFGVHVNATEAYPEAKTFDETLVDENSPGWDWIDQSYYIDQRTDLATKNIVDRFAQLRRETHPNLDFLYIDVYYSFGWLQERLAQELRGQGWNIGTEWSYHFEEDALWSHWANDESYGGATNKGLNSQMIRFVRNGQKDTWNPDKLLGHTEIVEFEGWTGENDVDAFYDNIWQTNLPTKYLQKNPILRWSPDEIVQDGGVRVVNSGKTEATRKIYQGGDLVLDGDAYLLPWKDSQQDGAKLYHYNADGGRTTWDLTDAWSRSGRLNVYELTEHGRVAAGSVPVRGGKVTLEAKAGTAYVLTKSPDSSPDPQWGQGSHVADPGFNAGDLDAWHPSGPATTGRTSTGQQVAVLGAGERATISQRLQGLRSGRNALGVWVEVEPGHSRATSVSVTSGGKTYTNSVERSTAKNLVAADELHSTYFQRVEVPFDAGRDGTATVKISAAAGSGRVRLDDVRVVAVKRDLPAAPGAKVIVKEDFEEVVQGWSPFVKGSSGGVTDPRTHLAERHEPYTQSGWNGKVTDDVISGDWSLKSHAENGGLVYRTVPQTVRLEPGHRYRVSFDHQTERADDYEWVTGYDSVASGDPRTVEVGARPIGKQVETARFSDEFVAGGCGDYWVGLRTADDNGANGDISIDDFTVEDLGAAGDLPACATLAVDAGDEKLLPGAAGEVTTTLTSDEASETGAGTVGLEVPEGWTAEATTPPDFDSLAPGESHSVTWKVTPPADAAESSYQLTGSATYDFGGETRTVTRAATVQTAPPPPTADTYASDLGWISATNGWGPVERDTSVGENAAGDGGPITLAGKVYAKGLGTHAVSKVRYYLAGNCTSFTADVGVDDVQTSRGSVRFSVVADGTTVTETGTLGPASATETITADITGATYVDLVAGDAGDGNGNDHADWADATFHCGG